MYTIQDSIVYTNSMVQYNTYSLRFSPRSSPPPSHKTPAMQATIHTVQCNNIASNKWLGHHNS
jgi:hypothetical protein